MSKKPSLTTVDNNLQPLLDQAVDLLHTARDASQAEQALALIHDAHQRASDEGTTSVAADGTVPAMVEEPLDYSRLPTEVFLTLLCGGDVAPSTVRHYEEHERRAATRKRSALSERTSAPSPDAAQANAA